VKTLLPLLLLLVGGCSMRSLYPTIGGGLGAGVGSIGGVGGAVAGGMSGAAVGSILKGDDDVKKITSTVKAISEGDVQGLINQGLLEQRSLFDQIIDGIYDLLLLCGVGVGLWILVPIIYSRYLHKKTDAKISEQEKKGNQMKE
tara:strand:+ start:1980 stop:2411 length:432 start_codon:yes stop_codon:yes gene_type:complete